MMNFLSVSFPFSKLLENICKKGRFWGNYHLISTLYGQSYAIKTQYMEKMHTL